jgi:hypothetical protein
MFHIRGNKFFPVELDVWVPNKKLAFEYQGEQHYSQVIKILHLPNLTRLFLVVLFKLK